MLILPGRGGLVGGGVQDTDNGGGTYLQGATEGTVPLRGLRVGDGGGICGRSQDDSAWASGRGATELENFGHGGRDADLLNGLSGQGRPAELPGGGMPRPSGNKDGDKGSIPIPACPGHHGNFGGGKPSPHMENHMQHDGTLEGTEWQVPCHILVC